MLGATVLAIVVVLQYDLFGTPTGDAQTEIIEHVALPLILFLLLFGTGAVLVVRRVERDLEKTAQEVSAAASRLESYDPNIQSFTTIRDLSQRVDPPTYDTCSPPGGFCSRCSS